MSGVRGRRGCHGAGHRCRQAGCQRGDLAGCSGSADRGASRQGRVGSAQPDLLSARTAVRVGTTVDFPNNDRVYHNVFSYRDGKRFDLGALSGRRGQARHLRTRGLEPNLLQHPPQHGRLRAGCGHALLRRLDREGRFSLPAVPPGSYTFHAWRPGAEELTGTVVIRPGPRWRLAGHGHAALLPFLALALAAVPAAAQRPTTEVDTTIGYTTEGLSTAASQVRTFGEIRPGLRYYFEGNAAVRTDRYSDAFGAAFPYTNGIRQRDLR